MSDTELETQTEPEKAMSSFVDQVRSQRRNIENYSWAAAVSAERDGAKKDPRSNWGEHIKAQNNTETEHENDTDTLSEKKHDIKTLNPNSFDSYKFRKYIEEQAKQRDQCAGRCGG